MVDTVPNGAGGHYALVLCARRNGNVATEEHNGVCEERALRLDDGGRLPLQGHEVPCASCGRATCMTMGVHGDAHLRGGHIEPDMADPRNRGIETGDARRAFLRGTLLGLDL